MKIQKLLAVSRVNYQSADSCLLRRQRGIISRQSAHKSNESHSTFSTTSRPNLTQKATLEVREIWFCKVDSRTRALPAYTDATSRHMSSALIASASTRRWPRTRALVCKFSSALTVEPPGQCRTSREGTTLRDAEKGEGVDNELLSILK